MLINEHINPEMLDDESDTIDHLSFCIISKLSDDIAEIVIKEGVEVTEVMLFDVEQWISKNLHTPAYVVMNKIFSHSYTFKAQIYLANLKNIKAMATVCYDNVSQATTMLMQSTTTYNMSWKMQVFDDRNEALQWIDEQKLACSGANHNGKAPTSNS